MLMNFQMLYGRLSLNSLNKLSAKKFVRNKTYKFQFNKILAACVKAHSKLIESENNLEGLEEEVLRNKLIKYIRSNQGTYGVAKYVFDAESAEIDNTTDKTVGYHDIKITIPCSSNFSTEEQKKFIIECKRIDGYASKNKAYIEEGINRFISEKYVCNLDVCGMIGFVEKSNKIYKNDKISEIVNDINDKLINTYNRNEMEKLQLNLIIDEFNSSYNSTHTREKCNLPIYITHLFLDMNNQLNNRTSY